MSRFPVPDDIPDSLQQYLLVWNEVDPVARRQRLDAAVTDDVEWVDPIHAHSGKDALEENVTGFRTEYPTAALGLGSNVDAHHDRCRYEWAIYTDDKLFMRGMDVVTFAESGLIERVDGFFGTLGRYRPKPIDI